MHPRSLQPRLDHQFVATLHHPTANRIAQCPEASVAELLEPRTPIGKDRGPGVPQYTTVLGTCRESNGQRESGPSRRLASAHILSSTRSAVRITSTPTAT